MRPLLRFWTVAACALVGSVILAAVHYIGSLPPNSLVPAAAPAAYTSVKVSDLLSVLITVSGVTVPILIGFLLIKGKDLQIAISERTELHLNQLGHSVKNYNLARLYMSSKDNAHEASDAFNCVDEFLSLGTHEGDERLTDLGKDTLFPTKGHGLIYNNCFANGRDKALILRCTVVTGVSAIICLIDMVIRFYGITSFLLDTAEQVMLPFTAAMNVFSYTTLVWIVHTKDVLRKEAFSRCKMSCRQIKPEIDISLRASKVEGKEMLADMSPATTTPKIQRPVPVI